MKFIHFIRICITDVRNIIFYLPLDVSSEELTLGDVHSVPGHSQPQLLGIGDRITRKALLTCCDTQNTQNLYTCGGWEFLKQGHHRCLLLKYYRFGWALLWFHLVGPPGGFSVTLHMYSHTKSKDKNEKLQLLCKPLWILNYTALSIYLYL